MYLFTFLARVLDPHQTLEMLVKRATAVAEKRGVTLGTVSVELSGNRSWLDGIAAGQTWPRGPTIKRAFDRLADLETKLEAEPVPKTKEARDGETGKAAKRKAQASRRG